MNASPDHLRFGAPARAAAPERRRFARVAMSLEETLAGAVPDLPPLPRRAHGYAIQSLAEDAAARLAAAHPTMRARVRRPHVRHHVDLGIGVDAWLAGMSGSARAGLARIGQRIAAVSGGALDIRRFATPGALIAFHDSAGRIASRTHQRTGLPVDDAFLGRMTTLAAAGRARGWLLSIAGEPAAYLYATARGKTLAFDHSGQDPAFDELSPGAILAFEAIRELIAEAQFGRLDLLKAGGRYRRALATGGMACVDLVLLRPSLADRVGAATATGIDRARTSAAELAKRPALKRLATRVRRPA